MLFISELKETLLKSIDDHTCHLYFSSYNFKQRRIQYINVGVNTLFKSKFENQDNSIIKVLDIPIKYDIKLIVQHIANITKKEIKSYEEIIKRSPPKNRNYQSQQDHNIEPSRTRFNTRRPQYKQAIIHFEDDGRFPICHR
ncbi:unnamed protein product [Rhizophagus irregularis]|nr:unnamed protein product [Rhizophagus irregularis]